MKVKKCTDGNYYVTRVPQGAGGKRRIRDSLKPFRNWFLLKHNGGSVALTLHIITFPKHFLGKKIRLKVELMEEG